MLEMITTLLLILAFIAALGGGIYFFTKENERNYEIDSKISNNEVVRIAQENRGWVTPQILCEKARLSRNEASRKLYIMLSEGVFKYDYDENYLPIFSLSSIVRKALDTENITALQGFRSRLSDSEVITFAVKSKGKITAAMLCIKANVSIDEAKNLLENLQIKGVFDVEVSEKGSIVYILNDFDMMSEVEA